MQHQILQCIEFKDKKVYTTITVPVPGAEFDLPMPGEPSPKQMPSKFVRMEHPALTEIYHMKGKHAVFVEVGKWIFEGIIHVHPHDCFTAEYLKRAGDMLKAPLRFSLDPKHAGEFIASVVEGYLRDPFYSPAKELKRLEELRSDPTDVLAICRYNPAAFNFSADLVRHDPEAAKQYITRFCKNDHFVYPSYFKDDKELAMMAVLHNPFIFKDLGPSVRNDMEIVRLAYMPKVSRKPGIYYVSHIGPDLLENDKFMREIMRSCPTLCMEGHWDMLKARNIAEGWILYNHFAMDHLVMLPNEVLAYESIHQALWKRAGRDTDLQKRVSDFLAMHPVSSPEASKVQKAKRGTTTGKQKAIGTARK